MTGALCLNFCFYKFVAGMSLIHLVRYLRDMYLQFCWFVWRDVHILIASIMGIFVWWFQNWAIEKNWYVASLCGSSPKIQGAPLVRGWNWWSPLPSRLNRQYPSNWWGKTDGWVAKSDNSCGALIIHYALDREAWYHQTYHPTLPNTTLKTG